jgi:hypothetical protein
MYLISICRKMLKIMFTELVVQHELVLAELRLVLPVKSMFFSLPDIEAYIKHKLPVLNTSEEQLETPAAPAKRQDSKPNHANKGNRRPRGPKRKAKPIAAGS